MDDPGSTDQRSLAPCHCSAPLLLADAARVYGVDYRTLRRKVAGCRGIAPADRLDLGDGTLLARYAAADIERLIGETIISRV